MRRLMLAALAGVLLALSGPAAAALAGPPHNEVAVEPASPAAYLDPMKHVAQTLNNCGPAAVVMALSTLGIDESQEVARLALRGSDVRRGMGPEPVGPWVDQRFGLKAVWRFSGTNELMKQLVTNGFAPMVTQWVDDPTVSRISHWRVVRGYDDAKGVFYVNDSMLGNDVPLTYDWFDQNWLPFGYRYMVIYEPDDEPLLRAIIGEQWDDYAMREAHYERMEALARGQRHRPLHAPLKPAECVPRHRPLRRREHVRATPARDGRVAGGLGGAGGAGRMGARHFHRRCDR